MFDGFSGRKVSILGMIPNLAVWETLAPRSKAEGGEYGNNHYNNSGGGGIH